MTVKEFAFCICSRKHCWQNLFVMEEALRSNALHIHPLQPHHQHYALGDGLRLAPMIAWCLRRSRTRPENRSAFEILLRMLRWKGNR